MTATLLGFAVAAGLALTGVAMATPPAAIAATTAPAPTGWLHTSGGAILDSNNAPHTIKAASWFGMETPDCMPHGLWGTLTIDDALANIKSMGFNTVRLPFSNECLAATTIKGNLNYWANRAYALEGKAPLVLMDTVIARAKANGLQIILDRHRPSSADQSPLWYTSAYPESKWIADWKMLAARYKNDPTVIGADLHNEPAGAATWGGAAATDWQAAATRGGNAVLAANPNLLIIVEGIENQGNGTSTWWGGGLADVKNKPVTLATPNRVVYSPHDYPASLFAQKWFSDANYPNNLPAVWDANWGYIQKQGIAPVLLGEFGTALQTTSDKQWMEKIVSYLGTNSMSFAYWSFNPNSGITGGLVQADWRTPEAAKLAALAPILKGTPTATASPSPSPTATVADRHPDADCHTDAHCDTDPDGHPNAVAGADVGRFHQRGLETRQFVDRRLRGQYRGHGAPGGLWLERELAGSERHPGGKLLGHHLHGRPQSVGDLQRLGLGHQDRCWPETVRGPASGFVEGPHQPGADPEVACGRPPGINDFRGSFVRATCPSWRHSREHRRI